jgi:hypothetical protein
MPRRTYAHFAAVLAGLAVAAAAGAAEPTVKTATPLPVAVPQNATLQQVQVVINGQTQTGYLILPESQPPAAPVVTPPPVGTPAPAATLPADSPAPHAGTIELPLHPTSAEPPCLTPVADKEAGKGNGKKEPKYTHPTANGLPKPGPEPKKINAFHWWRSGLNSGGSANPIGCGTTMSEYTFLWGSCCRFFTGGFYGDVNKYGEYGVLNGGCGPQCRRY